MSRVQRRSGFAIGALGLTVALVAQAAPATAAFEPGSPWQGLHVAPAFTPSPSVDGEISVTDIELATGATSMRSVTASGTPVEYADVEHGTDHRWGPAGDVLAVTTPDPATPGTGSSVLETVETPVPASWSSTGSELLFADDTSNGLQPTGAWLSGGSTTDRLTNPDAAAVSMGPPVDTPVGDGLLAEVDRGAGATIGAAAVSSRRWLAADLNGPRTDLTAPNGSAISTVSPTVSARGQLATTQISGNTATLQVEGVAAWSSWENLATTESCGDASVAFSPSGTRVAYVVTTGTCSSSALHVRTLGADGTFGSGTDTVVATSAAGHLLTGPSWRALTPAALRTRMSGSDRVATAIAISRAGWPKNPNGVPATWHGVVLASSAAYPDALVGVPLAGMLGAPLLVTPPDHLDSRVLAEIKRLKEGSDMGVVLVGGTGALSTAIESELVRNGIPPTRIGGSDRYATSVAMAKELDAMAASGSSTYRHAVVLASGRTFPDALSAGPAATQLAAPVLLTNGTRVPSSVAGYINARSRITQVWSVGDSAVTAAKTFGARASGRGIGGADRYATSAEVARRFFPGSGVVGYASGANFPDALAGGALMSYLSGPLVLTTPKAVPADVDAFSWDVRGATDQVIGFGGAGALSDGVLTSLATAAGSQTALWGPTTPLVANPVFIDGSSPTPGPYRAGGTAATLDTRDRGVFTRNAGLFNGNG